MSSNPRWWPYRIPIEEAFKKSAVLVVGIIVGANAISYYWQPMQEYNNELERGKIELLRKYKSINDERQRKREAEKLGQ